MPPPPPPTDSICHARPPPHPLLQHAALPSQATPLSTHAVLKLSKELPVVVEYHIPETGRLAFYLAPKIEEEEMAE